MVQKYAPVVVEEVEIDGDDEDYHEEIEQAQQAYAEKVVELESRVAAVETASKATPKLQVIRETIVDTGAERRARARAAKEEVMKGIEQ